MTLGMASAGTLIALALVVPILAFRLWRETGQRRELEFWLRDPERHAIPDGRGPWRGIFSSLQRLRKDERMDRAALASSLERFRMAVQALPDGVVVLDATGHIEWMNGAAAEHLHLDPTRDIGILIEQLIRRTGFSRYLEEYRAGKEPAPLLLPAGDSTAGAVVSVMLISFAGAGTLVVSRDITEIFRTEAMRKDFIANVSHELRTPLTVVAGFLEQLNGDNELSKADSRRFVQLMSEQALRMTRLVEDLLTLSQLESDNNPPALDTVNVPSLVQSLLEEARALSHGQHTIEAGKVSPIWLRGSTEELRSAFSNLLSNAVRYTPPGGRITVSWQGESGQPTLTVSDSGIGIPAEHVPRLTERFYRVDKGRSSSSGGTGLGLAIVKHVLARHDCKLTIDSAVGQGSRFSAGFPQHRAVTPE